MAGVTYTSYFNLFSATTSSLFKVIDNLYSPLTGIKNFSSANLFNNYHFIIFYYCFLLFDIVYYFIFIMKYSLVYL